RFRTLAHDARATCDARPEVADDREDRGRVEVDAAHDEHVVATPEDALAERGSLAFTRRALDAHDVAAEKADHRHRFAGEGRVGHLTHRTRLYLHRFSLFWIDQLDPYVPAAAKVHALLMRALAEQRRRDVADAHHLGH